MNTQPEALRLAEWLDGAYEGDAQDAAVELRRLHALNQELLELLKAAHEALDISYPLHSCDMRKRFGVLDSLRAAITKATGKSA